MKLLARSLLSFSIMSAGVATAGEPPILELGTGLFTRCAQPNTIYLSFRNTTKEQLEIPEGLLPWQNRLGIRFRAVQVSGGKSTPLTTVAAPKSFLGRKSVAPGQVVWGSMHFSEMVEDFEKHHRNGDILVSYKFLRRDIKGLPNFVGAPGLILIPRSRDDGSNCTAVLTEDWSSSDNRSPR